MKPWKKLLLGLAGVFALTALAACSSSTNTLDKVKDMLDNSDKDALRIKACSSG